MKSHVFGRILLLAAAAVAAQVAAAQGIVVHKQGGETIAVPYTELDYISTYAGESSGEADGSRTFTVNGVSFRMMPVAGGVFEMGATDEQGSGYVPYEDERPVHSVTLGDYFIGETEVTQALWQTVMGGAPSSTHSWSQKYGLGDNYPAYFISYAECQTFISRLCNLTGAAFRMPTEAEWEYAARGGRKSQGYVFSGSNDIAEVAWYAVSGNADDGADEATDYGTREVATRKANELGVYDMSGNVWEWCSDWYGAYSPDSQTNPKGAAAGTFRVFRGGRWHFTSAHCRVSFRNGGLPSDRSSTLGLRLAL